MSVAQKKIAIYLALVDSRLNVCTKYDDALFFNEKNKTTEKIKRKTK